MLKGRDKLERELCATLIKHGVNRKMLNQIVEVMAEKGYPFGEAQGMVNMNIPLNTLDNVDLYVLTEAVSRITGEEMISPAKYFTEVEIAEGKKFVRVQDKVKSQELVFENIEKVADDFYTGILTYEQVANLYSTNKITYNKQTQRNTVMRKHNKTLVPMINLNKTSVKQIRDLMLEGLFIPNAITLNALKDNNYTFDYNSKTKTLIIKAETLDITDGFHRSIAMLEARAINPNLQGVTLVNFTNFDTLKAQQFIVQEDKKNKISKRYISSINVLKNESLIVKALNENLLSELRGKITSDVASYKAGLSYVMSDTLAEAIKHEFNPANMRDVAILTDWLIKGLNEIIGLNYKSFKDVTKTREENIITNNMTFVGFVTILHKLQDRENWRAELLDILNKIDFTKDNPIWQELDMANINPNKTSIKSVSNYFKGII